MANELSTRIDRDRFHMVSRDKVAAVAHALLDGANHERAEELAAGVAVLFAVMAERTGMDPEEYFRFGRKVLHAPDAHHQKANIQMEALRDFAGLRVRNNPLI